MVTVIKQQWLDSYRLEYKLQSSGNGEDLQGSGCLCAGVGGPQEVGAGLGPAILTEPQGPGRRQRPAVTLHDSRWQQPVAHRHCGF